MIRRCSKKLLVILISIAATGTGLIWACADGGWDEYGVSAFAPEAFVAKEYSPFFYSDQFYYGIGHDTRHTERFNEDIVSDWSSYLNTPLPDTGLRYLLLTATKSAVDSLIAGHPADLPGVPASDMVLTKRKEKKFAAFYRFLSLAKYNESYAAIRRDYWGYEEPKDTVYAAEAGFSSPRLEQEFNAAKDDFLKQRYWFQLLRSYFFSGAYNQCISAYDSYKNSFPANNIAVRAMSYAAGAYYKQKDYANANYLYSRVYDAGAGFKTVAHFSFHPQQEADWLQTLRLCRNKEEQATLWQLLGIYFDGPRAIREIYALDPRSEKLELLLSRLINIEENRVSGNRDHYNDEKLHTVRDSASKALLDLVGGIAASGNTSKPYMWRLAEGYLNFLYEDYKRAEHCYAKVDIPVPVNELVQAQKRLLIFINRVGAAAEMNTASEQLLLPDLNWLQELSAGKQTIADLRYTSSYEWAKRKLGARYAARKDWLKAECLSPGDAFYTAPERVKAMKRFLQEDGGSAFEQYCRNIYPVTAADISEYQAILLTMNDQLDQAIPLMETAAGSATVLLGNPFNGRIRDCHDCDHEAPQKIKYTKLDLLRKLKEMKDIAAAGTDAYANYSLLGNAFYNITYYGNARYFYECKVINGYYASLSGNNFQPVLTDCRLAMSYYRKALAAAKTDEQKAKSTFMIAKCEQNQRFNRERAAGKLDNYGYSYFGPVDFKAMMAYRNTRYYQEVIRECGYFRTYLGMN